MTTEELLARFRKGKTCDELINALQKGESTQVKGLSGSSLAFVAEAYRKESTKNILFVADNKEKAAYFYNDLERLSGEDDKNILFFPRSYKKYYEPETVENANVLMRAEVLNTIGKQLGKAGGTAIVTYPEALLEKVVTRKHLHKNTLVLHVGEKVDPEFIQDVLQEFLFERVDFVIEPGQYSVRGGIVDIFSYANEYPYRVEFFGKDVESIRSFDTSTQLSVAKFNNISIVPNINEKLLLEYRESLLDYLGDNFILWFSDAGLCMEKIAKEFSLATDAFEKSESLVTPLKPEELFIDEKYLSQALLSRQVIDSSGANVLKLTHSFAFNTGLQPSFNKNFELFVEFLINNKSKKSQTILFADSAKQIERIYSILNDINLKKKILPAGEDFSTFFTPIHLSIHEGFSDNELNIHCFTDHQLFGRYHRFKLKDGYHKNKQAITLKELHGLNPGDYVTHIDHGVGRFAGLEKIDVNGREQEAIRLVYRDNDMLYVSIHSLHRITKFTGQDGSVPKINKLGSNAWANLKQKTKNKVKEIAYDLIQLYAKRKTQKGFEFAPDNYLQTELEASFIYEDTPDQEKATAAVKKDMEASFPMDRLVCGDVGFGKTEVAMRAAFKAVCDNKQVAILVPTTILALQHYKTFSERLKDFPCKVDYINRFRTAKEKKNVLEKLKNGQVDILIGTHAIVGKDVKFKDLGLLIIDEEQKFGVAVKDKLKTIKANVDALTLTATPIPRTLQFSMMGARDLSVIATAPPNRQPVQTELHNFNEEVIRDAIMFEMERDGQVFFIHNRVQNIDEVASMITRLCPDARVTCAHGQMEGDKLEEVMMDFVDGKYDVLVATTIVESGLDIPNANTILINQAQHFGLSDLHQMRGRVGRSNIKAFCYLLAPPLSTLTNEAAKRLKAIEDFAELGSGFNIAMKDLDIRGAGNLLGGEQSGFIAEIGFEMYMKILDEAVEELRDAEFANGSEGKNNEKQFVSAEEFAHGASGKRNFVKDTQIDTDLEVLIPDEYVSNITERLLLYKDLDEQNTEQGLLEYEKNLIDRFGPVPPQAMELIDTVRLRMLAMEIGFEKLVLKGKRLVCYFISKPESQYFQSEIFSTVLRFVQKNHGTVKMKEQSNKLSLSFENIKNVKESKIMLEKILNS